MDWETCLFCKKKSHKKVKDLINIRTFQVCETIYSIANARADNDLLMILDGVNNDLVAAEGKYHKNCFSAYVAKRNVSANSFKEPLQEDQYAGAFQELVSDISQNIYAGKAYSMNNLLLKYRAILETKGVSSQSYSCQRLKLRMKNHFSDSIVFHQPYDHTKSELVYSISVTLQDVINSAFRQSSSDNPVSQTNTYGLEQSSEFPNEQNRALYEAAMLIRSEIRQTSGISIKPLNPNDLTLKTAKNCIPQSLYRLLRWIIDAQDRVTEYFFDLPECLNSSDERRIIMIAQDITHCASRGKIKTPKHTSLAMTVRHITRSKQLVTLLNRMGHCSSYDTLEIIDTNLAREVAAKSEEYGIVIPFNISPGSFVQFAADDNDINEETLDGKHSTHATTLVVYQKGTFGPAPHRRRCADYSHSRKSLSPQKLAQTVFDFNASGKRPPVRNLLTIPNNEWFKPDRKLLSSPISMDLAWALVRLFPNTLFRIETAQATSNEPGVPSWGGFNSLLNSTIPIVTNIGYCPMINAPSTDYSTVYTVMKTVQKIVSSVGQAKSVVTFDLLIYMKAKEIQWRRPDEFADTIVRLGGFHIALNFLAVMGKMYDNSDLEDLLIESGVYAGITASQLLQGKHYNRGVRSIQWQEFLTWYRDNNLNEDDLQQIQSKVSDAKCALTEGCDISSSFDILVRTVSPIQDKFIDFKNEGRKSSRVFVSGICTWKWLIYYSYS